MPWIESHTVLLRHRKLKPLAFDLRLKPVYVLGHLHALWHVALEQAEDGDLSHWTDEFIADSACYSGDPHKFVQLLQKHEWLEGHLIHDWLDYAGKYLESKYRSSKPERLIAIWAKHGIEYNKTFGRQAKPGWIALRKEILERDSYICHYCGKTSDHMEVDHLVPVSEGGADDPSNLVACCRSCNRKKNTKPYESQTKASPPNSTLPDLTKQEDKEKTGKKPPVPVENPELKKLLEDVFKSGFNIYQLIGKFRKEAKNKRLLMFGEDYRLPDEILIRVCESYLKNRLGIKGEHFPWVLSAISKASTEWWVSKQDAEHLKIKTEGAAFRGGDMENLQDILKRMLPEGLANAL